MKSKNTHNSVSYIKQCLHKLSVVGSHPCLANTHGADYLWIAMYTRAIHDVVTMQLCMYTVIEVTHIDS